MQLLLESSYLLERGIIDNNVDTKKLNFVIETVQDLYIKPLIGTKLFNAIRTQSIPPATSLTPANETLLNDYILKIMVLYVQARMTSVLKYRYMNKGVMAKSAENASPIDLAEVKYLEDKFVSDAQVYADQMKRFIIANLTDYPLYYANNGINEINPQPAADIDIYLSNGPEVKYTNDSGELNID